MNVLRQEAETPRADDHCTRARIVIIDQREPTAPTIETILRQGGFEAITTVTDPYRAMELCREDRANLLLLELNPPDSDSLAVIRSLRAEETCQNLPVLAITGEADHSVRLGAYRAGATDFISRPLDASEVICRVRNILRMYLLQRDLRRTNADLEATVQRRTAKLETMIDLVRQAEAKLGAALSDAQARSRGKTEMLANVSHELRTPLTAIIGFAELLRDESTGPLSEDRRRGYAGDIHDAAGHALSVINDLLDVSKAEAGVLDIVIKDADVAAAVTSSVSMLAGIADKANIGLSVDIPDNFPVLRTDETRLRQVLVNVVTNAIKFTPSGGSVKVRARHNPEDGALIMVVTDTGVGIARKDMDKVMRAYGQAGEACNEVQNSTGLGLPLTRRMVEALGGRLELSSQVGVGTVVTMHFPPDMVRAPEHVHRHETVT